jgi:co-chaperonin GroES (HSP10)
MKAINYYVVVEKIKQPPKKVGGLELSESNNDEERYSKGLVISVGNLVEGTSDIS